MTPHDDALIINHPDTGFISVAGDDSCAFLQSIITANVETLPVSACRPSALLTPQGRVLIDMMVYRPSDQEIYLQTDPARAGGVVGLQGQAAEVHAAPRPRGGVCHRGIAAAAPVATGRNKDSLPVRRPEDQFACRGVLGLAGGRTVLGHGGGDEGAR